MHRACSTAFLALAIMMGACGARSDLSASSVGGSGSASTSSAGGSAGACAPGETRSCYDGPPSTEGVGVCRSGLSVCVADGSGFGPCTGQVLPGMDDCITPEDEDCDGSPAACLGLCWWSRSFGGPGIDWVQDAAASASGAMVLTGTVSGPVDFGGTTIAGAESTSFFAASLTPDGATAWGKRLGGVEGDGLFASPIPATLSGNVVFAGYGFFPLDFGGGPVASPYLLAELTEGGAHVFSGPLGAAIPAGASLQIHDVVILADGSIRALVTANSPLVFGDAAISAGPGDASKSVVLAFDAAGAPVTAWSTGAGIITRGHLAVSESGVTVTVGPIGAASTPTLTALAPSGAPLFTWSVLCDEPALCNISGVGVGVDGAGNVFATGEIVGVADLGGGPVGAPDAYSVFVTALDPSGGHRWDRVFIENNATVPEGTARRGPLALSPSGDIVVAGQFSGTTDFGMGPVTSNGETDVFVVSLSFDDGALRWARTFGGADAETIRAIAVDDAGRVRIAGIFQGSFDAGCGPLQSKGDWDVFAAALLP
ncbi:Tryptophan synthase alpha chain [Minicystis rosea]|nr:Tryptophan synthase alpha chain [Minicystis rosea]